jgi:hypothetical protein
VDVTAPATAIDSAPAATTNATNATFTFSASQSGSTFECSLDGAPFGACTSPAAFSGLAEGSHTFDVRATDPAGNTDQTPAGFTWTVDLTAPQTTVDSGPTEPTSDPDAAFTFSSSEPGSTFECSLDGTPFSACTSPATYTGLAPGSHTFEVRAVDAAGNADPSPATYGWTIT